MHRGFRWNSEGHHRIVKCGCVHSEDKRVEILLPHSSCSTRGTLELLLSTRLSCTMCTSVYNVHSFYIRTDDLTLTQFFCTCEHFLSMTDKIDQGTLSRVVQIFPGSELLIINSNQWSWNIPVLRVSKCFGDFSTWALLFVQMSHYRNLIVELLYCFMSTEVCKLNTSYDREEQTDNW